MKRWSATEIWSRSSDRAASGPGRLDPDRFRAAAQLTVSVEQRRAGFVFAAVRGDVPCQDATGLFDVDTSIHVRRELPEQPLATAGLVGGEAAGAIHRGPHELGKHLAVAAIERGVRYPGRREHLAS